MREPILSIRDLTIRFRAQSGESMPAVSGIDLDLFAGEMMALVGESGSGKSVTALAILGLLESPAAEIVRGSIVYRREGGEALELLALRGRELCRVRGREIAMIFQEPMTSLNPVLSIGAQIVEAIRLHEHVSFRDAKRKAIQLLERVGIPDAARRFRQFPHEFSGGMRQRVMIAIALSCRPRLLIADEPTTALDVTVQRSVLDLLKELVDDTGLGLLFITHDLTLVSAYASRVGVLQRGQFVELGSAERVFRHAMHPYTRRLLAAVPVIGSKLNRLAEPEGAACNTSVDSLPVSTGGEAASSPIAGPSTEPAGLSRVHDNHYVRIDCAPA